MVMMDNTLDLKGRMKGGLLQAAIRTVANGESFFQQEITAPRGNGMCLLAPNRLRKYLPIKSTPQGRDALSA
jgi:uncharacterized protein (AIM24 family)